MVANRARAAGRGESNTSALAAVCGLGGPCRITAGERGCTVVQEREDADGMQRLIDGRVKDRLRSKIVRGVCSSYLSCPALGLATRWAPYTKPRLFYVTGLSRLLNSTWLRVFRHDRTAAPAGEFLLHLPPPGLLTLAAPQYSFFCGPTMSMPACISLTS